jgi:hypothetical protein
LIQINTKKQMLMICKSETKMQCQTFGGAEYIIERSSLGKIKYAWLFDIGPLSIQFVSDPFKDYFEENNLKSTISLYEPEC